MLLELSPRANRQSVLFDTRGGVGDARSAKLMYVLDGINQRYGRWALRLAAEGVERAWQMRRGNMSPGYTTSWEDLPIVRAS